MLFELERVTIERDSRVVLQDVTASLPKGASCIAGPSGSGKSTLLRLLNRLADPVAGAVRYEGADVRERDPLELRREVCLVPQLPALLEGTVEENIRFAAELAGREPEVGRLLDLAGLDASFAARDSGKLSVGEQQRVMLARALALEPRVLLAGRAHLGPRRGRAGGGGGDPAWTCAGGSRSRPCWSPTTSTRRAGWPTGWCGSTRGGSLPRAGSRSSSAFEEPRPGRPRFRPTAVVVYEHMFVSESPAQPADRPPEDLPLEHLEHQICQLAAQLTASTARWLALVGEFDRRDGWWSCPGIRSMVEWVSWRCALSPRAAREQVRVARALPELPRIREAFESGQLSYSKVRVLTRVAEPGSEADLLELARYATAAQLERMLRAFRRVSRAEAQAAYENRYLTYYWDEDGSLCLRARLPAEEGALVLEALHESRDALFREREDSERGPADQRRLELRRAAHGIGGVHFTVPQLRHWSRRRAPRGMPAGCCAAGSPSPPDRASATRRGETDHTMPSVPAPSADQTRQEASGHAARRGGVA